MRVKQRGVAFAPRVMRDVPDVQPDIGLIHIATRDWRNAIVRTDRGMDNRNGTNVCLRGL